MLLAVATGVPSSSDTPEPIETPAPDLAAVQTTVTGKTGNPGRQPGKVLPPGKLPVHTGTDQGFVDGQDEESEIVAEEPASEAMVFAPVPTPMTITVTTAIAASPMAVRLPVSPHQTTPQPANAKAVTIGKTGSAPANAAETTMPQPLPGSLLAAMVAAAPVEAAAPQPAAAPIVIAAEALNLQVPLVRLAGLPVASRLAAQAEDSVTATTGMTSSPRTNDLSATTAPIAEAAVAPVVARVAEHKTAQPAQAAATDMIAAPALPEPMPVATTTDTRAPAAPSSASPQVTSTQDVAALVDRIAEARAAAAPTTVRAALMHEEFGSVSLRIRAEDAHIHVTLGNADPGFAPAVQAAVSASFGKEADDQRRDGQAQQQAASAQDDPLRREASSQRQTSHDRAGAEARHAPGERRQGRAAPAPVSAGSTPSDSAYRQRGGMYA